MAHRLAVRQAIRSVAAAVVVGVAALAAAPAQAAFPGANGKIAFSASSYGSIDTINPDGTNDLPLADGYGPPAWSADGTKLAFVRADYSHRPFAGVIYTMNDDGSGITQIGPGAQPEWSPDGQKLVFTVGEGERERLGEAPNNNLDIYVMNADGSGVTNLTNNPCEWNSGAPSWSPDGTKIAFSRHEINSCGDIEPYTVGRFLIIMNTDGSDQTSLGSGTDPDWSPDGRRIAVDGIGVVNADGSGAVGFPPDAGRGDRDPAWSPDGRKIAFDRELLTTHIPSSISSHLMVMNADGTGLTQLTHDVDPESGTFNGAPSWQPLPTAAYEHPQSATSLSASLVPTFRPCGTGANPTNGQHGPPVHIQSCVPPTPGSNVARFGSTSTGSASLTVAPGDTDPTNGDQADVTLTASLSDVNTTGGADYVPNASGPDLTEITRLRLTDKANYGGASGTATEYDFRVPLDCAATSDPSVGSTCSTSTSADSLVPGFITEQRRTVVQAFRVRVDDAGANDTTGDSDDRIFATQGIYVP